MSRTADSYPQRLTRLASPPETLFATNTSLLDQLLERPVVGVIGARSVTPYGRLVTEKLVRELCEQGIVVVSGLALGVDGIAHTSALNAQGYTIAVLPGPLDEPFPVSHRTMAQRIIDQDGVLISEYPTGSQVNKTHFIARNRIIAGLSDVLLITEAGEQSGSLHTARFMLEMGREVLAVPGPITSRQSTGTHNLIKSGAGLVTGVDDVLLALGLVRHSTKAKVVRGRNQQEQNILDAMIKGTSDGQALLAASGLPIGEFNGVLTALEIGGKIRPLGNNQWVLT